MSAIILVKVRVRSPWLPQGDQPAGPMQNFLKNFLDKLPANIVSAMEWVGGVVMIPPSGQVLVDVGPLHPWSTLPDWWIIITSNMNLRDGTRSEVIGELDKLIKEEHLEGLDPEGRPSYGIDFRQLASSGVVISSEKATVHEW